MALASKSHVDDNDSDGSTKTSGSTTAPISIKLNPSPSNPPTSSISATLCGSEGVNLNRRNDGASIGTSSSSMIHSIQGHLSGGSSKINFGGMANARQDIGSAPRHFAYSSSPRSPLADSGSLDRLTNENTNRRSLQLTTAWPAATSPTIMLSQPPASPSPSFLTTRRPNRRRSSHSFGSYELSGRMTALYSQPLSFKASIGVSGGPGSPASLICPNHLNLDFEGYYEEEEVGRTGTSNPYVATIELEKHFIDLVERINREGGQDATIPKLPYYQLPKKGLLQIALKHSESSTSLKLFLVPYDLTQLGQDDAGGRTFLRQKSSLSEEGVHRLRDVIHINFCSPPKASPTATRRYYLCSTIRIVFRSEDLEMRDKLRITVEGPEVTEQGGGMMQYVAPSERWNIARKKAKARGMIPSFAQLRVLEGSEPLAFNKIETRLRTGEENFSAALSSALTASRPLSGMVKQPERGEGSEWEGSTSRDGR